MANRDFLICTLCALHGFDNCVDAYLRAGWLRRREKATEMVAREDHIGDHKPVSSVPFANKMAS